MAMRGRRTAAHSADSHRREFGNEDSREAARCALSAVDFVLEGIQAPASVGATPSVGVTPRVGATPRAQQQRPPSQRYSSYPYGPTRRAAIAAPPAATHVASLPEVPSSSNIHADAPTVEHVAVTTTAPNAMPAAAPTVTEASTTVEVASQTNVEMEPPIDERIRETLKAETTASTACTDERGALDLPLGESDVTQLDARHSQPLRSSVPQPHPHRRLARHPHPQSNSVPQKADSDSLDMKIVATIERWQTKADNLLSALGELSCNSCKSSEVLPVSICCEGNDEYNGDSLLHDEIEMQPAVAGRPLCAVASLGTSSTTPPPHHHRSAWSGQWWLEPIRADDETPQRLRRASEFSAHVVRTRQHEPRVPGPSRVRPTGHAKQRSAASRAEAVEMVLGRHPRAAGELAASAQSFHCPDDPMPAVQAASLKETIFQRSAPQLAKTTCVERHDSVQQARNVGVERCESTDTILSCGAPSCSAKAGGGMPKLQPVSLADTRSVLSTPPSSAPSSRQPRINSTQEVMRMPRKAAKAAPESSRSSVVSHPSGGLEPPLQPSAAAKGNGEGIVGRPRGASMRMPSGKTTSVIGLGLKSSSAGALLPAMSRAQACGYPQGSTSASYLDK